MKKIILTAILILLCSVLTVMAANIASDPGVGVAVYQVELDGVLDETIYAVESDLAIKHDISNWTPGTHTTRFRFGAEITSDNGTAYVWSAYSDPFGLTIPAAPNTTLNLILTP